MFPSIFLTWWKWLHETNECLNFFNWFFIDIIKFRFGVDFFPFTILCRKWCEAPLGLCILWVFPSIFLRWWKQLHEPNECLAFQNWYFFYLTESRFSVGFVCVSLCLYRAMKMASRTNESLHFFNWFLIDVIESRFSVDFTSFSCNYLTWWKWLHELMNSSIFRTDSLLM